MYKGTFSAASKNTDPQTAMYLYIKQLSTTLFGHIEGDISCRLRTHEIKVPLQPRIPEFDFKSAYKTKRPTQFPVPNVYLYTSHSPS